MSAIVNGLQPVEYLEKVIEDLPVCKTSESIKSLLHHEVAAAMNLAVDFRFTSKVPGRPEAAFSRHLTESASSRAQIFNAP